MSTLALAGPRAPKRFRTSLSFAWAGLRYAYQTQPHVRVHLATGATVAVLGVLLRVTPTELAILIAAVTLVLTLELLNTVVETVVDLVTAEFHPLAKTAKDVSAGAVLAAAAGAAAVGVVIFLPRLLQVLAHLPV